MADVAEAPVEYLYTRQAENEEMKTKVAETGARAQFDRREGAFKLVTEGMDPANEGKLREVIAPYQTAEAKLAWEADRAEVNAQRETLKAAAKEREGTTQEPAPAKAPKELEAGTYRMFRTPDEKDAFTQLLQETGSQSRYQKATANMDAHFVVKTDKVEAFAQYMGAEAEARFKAAAAVRSDASEKSSDVGGDIAVARKEAASREAKAFMAQYAERGFRLKDSGRDPEGHQAQLNQMAAATTSQLLSVLRKSRELLEPLRAQEVSIRAEAAGMSVEQMKALSFDDQKKAATVDGKPVGLTGKDFALNAQLSKGIGAIVKELEGRGAIKARDTERSKGAEQGAEPATPAAERPAAEQSAAKTDIAQLHQAHLGRRGRGR